MRRLALLFAVVGALFAPGLATAQTDSPRVYIAYFNVDFSDLPAWIENYQEVEPPILDGMVDEGILSGFGLTDHDTGGPGNVKLVYVPTDWDTIDELIGLIVEGAEGIDPENMRAALRHEGHIWRMVPRSGM